MSQFVPSDRVTHIMDLMHRAEMSNGSSVPSNWGLFSIGSNGRMAWAPQMAGGAGVSYGSNAMDVTNADNGGASTDVSRMDHRHKGVHQISSASSNTLFGDINFVGQGSVGVTVSGQTIQFSGPGSSGGGAAGTTSPLSAVWGGGSDGDVTIAAGTTALTRDMYYNNLTVTGTLDVNGWRVFVKNTISGAGTVISNGGNGGNGGNGTGAAGGSAGGAGANTSANNLGRGGAGTAGRVGGFNAVGLNGTAGQLSTMFRMDGTAIVHPNGANGGAGANAGGTGATGTTGTNTLDAKPLAYPACVEYGEMRTGTAISPDSITGKPAGAASGGGSAAGGGGGSGGTGAGGGPIVLVAKTWTGSFNVRSTGGNGGNGGNGFASSGSNGGGASGNGAGGGVVIVLYADRSGWSGTATAPGGTAGTAGSGNGGGAAGGTGSSGPSGIVIEFPM